MRDDNPPAGSHRIKTRLASDCDSATRARPIRGDHRRGQTKAPGETASASGATTTTGGDGTFRTRARASERCGDANDSRRIRVPARG